MLNTLHNLLILFITLLMKFAVTPGTEWGGGALRSYVHAVVCACVCVWGGGRCKCVLTLPQQKMCQFNKGYCLIFLNYID